MRALAAVAVVVTHVAFQSGRSLSGALGAPLSRLDAGVTVFFVLSGFLLGRPFALWLLSGAPRPDLRRYALRRAARLLPAYWLLVVVTLLVTRPAQVRSAGDWAWQLALGQTYDDMRLLPALTHVWSLGAELAFYAALPLLALAAARWARGPRAARRLLLALAGSSAASLGFLAAAHAGVGLHPQAHQWLPAHLTWFAAGLALAVLTTPQGRQTRPGRLVADLAASPAACWVAAGLLLWLASTPVAGGRGLVHHTPFEALSRELLYAGCAVLLMVPVVAGARSAGLVRRALQSRPAVHLGEVSYGLFLWHLLVLEQLQSALGLETFHGHFWPVLAVVLPVSVLVATVSWVVLERPLLGLVDRRLAARG